MQPPFSAISRDAGEDILPRCANNETGVIVYAPMESGLLSGGFSSTVPRRLSADDWRHGHPDFSGEGLRRNLAVADAMAAVASRHGATTSAIAVAWTLAWPGVTGAIAGAKDPQQLASWVAAGEITLGTHDLEEIAGAIERSGAGAGPARPQISAAR